MIEAHPLNNFIQAAEKLSTAEKFDPTDVHRDAYIDLAQGILSAMRQHQDATGGIVDPVEGKEIPGATACYALAAGLLAFEAGRSELGDGALKAMDHALGRLKTPSPAREWFFALLAVKKLQAKAPAAKAREWQAALAGLKGPEAASQDADSVYALAAESLRTGSDGSARLSALLQSLSPEGLCPAASFSDELALRGPLEILLEQNLLAGTPAWRAALGKAALTGLFLQSPCGEVPTGGPHAQHQRNEALQCLVFESWAARKQQEGDLQWAGMFKRAARLSLQSLSPWVRESGDLHVVKNYFDPKQRHGFESDTFHSLGNLLTASWLALAWSASDEKVGERACPCECGGFALYLAGFHQIVANAKGLYVQVDTLADPQYNSTGFLRLHKKTHDPLSGPSDNCPSREIPLTVGVAWQEGGHWPSLAGLQAKDLAGFSFQLLSQQPNQVTFTAHWRLKEGSAVRSVKETYRMTSKQALVGVELEGKVEQIKVRFPGLVFDGKRYGDVSSRRSTASAQFGKDRQVLSMKNPTFMRLATGEDKFSNRNGFFQVAEGSANANKVLYSLRPQRAL